MNIFEAICFSGIVAACYKNKQIAFIWCCLIFILIYILDISKLWLVCTCLVVVESIYLRKLHFLLASQIVLATLIKSF